MSKLEELEELIKEFENFNSIVQDSSANDHYKQGYKEAVNKFKEIVDDIYEQGSEGEE